VQVQQRQHLTDLRGLARPRRQDRRAEPLPLTGFRVNALVVDARRVHLHRARAGDHITRLVVAVAHHQPAPVLVALIGEPGDVGVDLGAQCLGQHPSRTFADELVDHLRRRTGRRGRIVAVGRIRNYSEHGTYLPDQRCRAGLAWNLQSVTREGTPLPKPIHRFQALLTSDCAVGQLFVRHPQKVLSRWWHRLCEEHFRGPRHNPVAACQMEMGLKSMPEKNWIITAASPFRSGGK
jgi:hypothetical protein